METFLKRPLIGNCSLKRPLTGDLKGLLTGGCCLAKRRRLDVHGLAKRRRLDVHGLAKRRRLDVHELAKRRRLDVHVFMDLQLYMHVHAWVSQEAAL